MGIGNDLETEHLALFIHQAQVADERRATQVHLDIGLQSCESLRQLHQESALRGRPKDQQSRTPVAKGYPGDVNVVSE